MRNMIKTFSSHLLFIKEKLKDMPPAAGKRWVSLAVWCMLVEREINPITNQQSAITL